MLIADTQIRCPADLCTRRQEADKTQGERLLSWTRGFRTVSLSNFILPSNTAASIALHRLKKYVDLDLIILCLL